MFTGKPEEFRGIYSLVMTPFKDDLTIDYDVYEKYVQWQCEKGSHHLFACCGSSEMTLLTPEERIKCATLAAKNSGDVEVMATANLTPSWQEQKEEVKAMSQTGVDALVFVTRGYADNDERLVNYIGELSQYTELPILLYEFPGMSPHCMSGKAYGELMKTGKIKGMKDTTSTMEGICDKIPYQGESAILQANIPFLLEAYKAGARGVCATPTSCGADLFRKMYDAFFVDQDMKMAEKHYHDIIMLDNAIDSGFMASAKYLVNLRGIPFGTACRTGAKLGKARVKSIEAYYEYAKECGILD